VSHKAYIAVGTNMGDRVANYRKAIAKIRQLPTARVTRESSLYESEPHGRSRKWFLNGVVELVTEAEARDLLKSLQQIETEMGRKKDPASVSRIIDLDILLFDREVINSKSLKVPHPEIPNRRFVLFPLSELVPAFKHPVLDVTVSTMLVTTRDDKRAVLYKPTEQERNYS
jgi:2-amino-4-hydroxy-6-hydroxymethyldihydropteridine diphosphokinase